MANHNSPTGISSEIEPITSTHAFMEPTSGLARVAFREGKIAGTHAAEELALEMPLEAVVEKARENYTGDHHRVIDADEFAVSSMLAGYQVRSARRHQ